MTRTLAVMLALVVVALVWQSWRLNTARHTIDTQETALETKAQELAKKNGQLISLAILTETNSREQMRLYAAAEQTTALLRNRQNRIPPPHLISTGLLARKTRPYGFCCIDSHQQNPIFFQSSQRSRFIIGSRLSCSATLRSANIIPDSSDPEISRGKCAR